MEARQGHLIVYSGLQALVLPYECWPKFIVGMPRTGLPMVPHITQSSFFLVHTAFLCNQISVTPEAPWNVTHTICSSNVYLAPFCVVASDLNSEVCLSATISEVTRGQLP